MELQVAASALCEDHFMMTVFSMVMIPMAMRFMPVTGMILVMRTHMAMMAGRYRGVVPVMNSVCVVFCGNGFVVVVFFVRMIFMTMIFMTMIFMTMIFMTVGMMTDLTVTNVCWLYVVPLIDTVHVTTAHPLYERHMRR